MTMGDAFAIVGSLFAVAFAFGMLINNIDISIRIRWPK